jgi:RecG-like helicase
MNLEKLQIAQQDFLRVYPQGFQDEKMLELSKKHRVDKMTDFVLDVFSRDQFNIPANILENWAKTVSRSSMVSTFEKPKFKNMLNDLSAHEKELMINGLYEQLHGDAEAGFNAQLDILKQYKLAKWSLISVVPAYFKPQEEVFIKPTTAKGVIKHFELPNLTYKATPSWEFYCEYRQQVLSMMNFVDKQLAPNTPAFCGFLMMSLPGS